MTRMNIPAGIANRPLEEQAEWMDLDRRCKNGQANSWEKVLRDLIEWEPDAPICELREAVKNDAIETIERLGIECL